MTVKYNGHYQGYTPWGGVQASETVAPGVEFVVTAGHGGLVLTDERWEQLPSEVRDTFISRGFAEEDCEYPIAMALLGLGDDRRKVVDAAILTAEALDVYKPALPYLLAERVLLDAANATSEELAAAEAMLHRM